MTTIGQADEAMIGRQCTGALASLADDDGDDLQFGERVFDLSGLGESRGRLDAERAEGSISVALDVIELDDVWEIFIAERVERSAGKLRCHG